MVDFNQSKIITLIKVALAGDFVANGNMIFDSGHPFLYKLMTQAEKKFTGQGWNSLGEKWEDIWIFGIVLNVVKLHFRSSFSHWYTYKGVQASQVCLRTNQSIISLAEAPQRCC